MGLRCESRPAVPEGPYLVAGLGEAGRSAVEALRLRQGSEGILASDHHPPGIPKRVRRALEDAGIRVHLGAQDELLDLPPAPRTLIKSPGVPADAPLIQRARERGLDVIDEVELGWRLGAAPMVAVDRDQRQDDHRDPRGRGPGRVRARVEAGRQRRHRPAALGRDRRPRRRTRSDRLRDLELPARMLPRTDARGRGLHQSQPRPSSAARDDAPLRRGQAEPVHQRRRRRSPRRRRHDRRVRARARRRNRAGRRAGDPGRPRA